MMVQKQIHVELKIFQVGPKKKIKFFKSRLNPLCNLEHFSLHTTKFTNYLYILSFATNNIKIKPILGFFYLNWKRKRLCNY